MISAIEFIFSLDDMTTSLLQKTQEEWRTAFYIAAGVYCLGAIAYIILAKGEVQAWAEYHDEGQDQELEEIKEEDGEAHSNHIAL